MHLPRDTDRRGWHTEGEAEVKAAGEALDFAHVHLCDADTSESPDDVHKRRRYARREVIDANAQEQQVRLHATRERSAHTANQALA